MTTTWTSRGKKALGCGVAGATALLGVAACGGSSSISSAGSSSSSSGHTPVIGMTVYDMSSFETLSQLGVEREAKALGDKLTWQSANGDVSQQISEIENFINQHVDAIVVDPVESASLGAQLHQARAAGIKVVATNVPLFAQGTNPTGEEAITGNSPYVQSYAGPDDLAAGQQEMKYLAKAMNGSGNLVEIQGPLAQASQASRTAGIAKELASYPNIHLLAKKPADWDRSKAIQVAEGFIAAYPNSLNGIVAENDDMAIGANQVLASHGLKGKLPVVGIDGIQDGMKAVMSGDEVETNLQDGMVEEGEAVWLADQLVRGHKVPKTAIYKMPAITKSNVQHYYDQMYASGRSAFLQQLPGLIAQDMKSGNYSNQ